MMPQIERLIKESLDKSRRGSYGMVEKSAVTVAEWRS
jgi:hypothetical protein